LQIHVFFATDLPTFHTFKSLTESGIFLGHFGAPDRLNFTALGNGVNTASRLESLNKHYGTSILVSESIYQVAQQEFGFRLLDFVKLKGETEAMSVYELIGKKGEKPEMNPVISKYEQALQVYRKGLFAEAMKLLKDQLSDGPSHTLHARCGSFLKNPPPGEWNGVYIFTVK